MKLFNVDDNADRNLDWEETTSMAVWAHDPAEAMRLYRDAYARLVEADRVPDVAELVCKEVNPLPSWVEPPAVPGIEDNPEVQRELGWRIENEAACSTCGLASMDLPQYRVCDECDQCLACGHDEGCEEVGNG